MKTCCLAIQSFAVLVSSSALATVHYVNAVSGNPAPPYTSWPTAANVIQDAVDVAEPGDTVLVQNGIYNAGGRVIYGSVTNRVAIDKPIIVQSVNGPSLTFIEGNPVPGDTAIRCAYLTNGASLIGFTLRNGATRTTFLTSTQDFIGGGVSCESRSATLSNCTLTANTGYWGGAAGFGSLWNCTISNNSANSGGGTYWSALNNCLVISNSASDFGGGLYTTYATNCTVVGNYGYSAGGGAYGSSLNWSTIIYNIAQQYGGGGASTLFNNCLVASNIANISGGGSEGGLGTVSRNTIFRGNFGGYCGGVLQGEIYNCVVAQNRGGTGPGGTRDVSGFNSIVYANTGPIPSDNFTNDPGFVNISAGDFHLRPDSPCINAGYNSAAPAGPDLDNHPRIVGGAIDLGPYEFQTPTSLISYAWLAQYGLPNDGSADFADPDHDGMDNYREWLSNTDPTNPNSVFKLSVVKTNLPGTTLSWKSYTSYTYYVQRTTNILAPDTFQTIKTNIRSQSNSIVILTDTNTIKDGSYFYRVGLAHY